MTTNNGRFKSNILWINKIIIPLAWNPLNKGGGGDPQTAAKFHGDLAIGCHTPPGGGIAPGNGGFVRSFTEAEIDEMCDEKFGAGRLRVKSEN